MQNIKLFNVQIDCGRLLLWMMFYWGVVMTIDFDLDVMGKAHIPARKVDFTIAVSQFGAPVTNKGWGNIHGKVKTDVGFTAPVGLAPFTKLGTGSGGCDRRLCWQGVRFWKDVWLCWWYRDETWKDVYGWVVMGSGPGRECRVD